MPDYKKSKIYCIRSYRTDEIYIGSTTQSLNARMGGHKRSYKLYLKKDIKYMTSYKILEHGDAYIELIELYPCSCKVELNRREGELIREMKCVNKCIAGRTREEWYLDTEYNHRYYQKNKERQKQYCEVNKGKILEYGRLYRKNNKKKLDEKRREKVSCECGAIMRKDCLRRHRRSTKHFRLMDALPSL